MSLIGKAFCLTGAFSRRQSIFSLAVAGTTFDEWEEGLVRDRWAKKALH
jgi:hypothetical protein